MIAKPAWPIIVLGLVTTPACGDNVCTLEDRSTPHGTITWTDETLRVPDRVLIQHTGLDKPHECTFSPPPEDGMELEYHCSEGPEGPARLIVLAGDQRWARNFTVTGDGCHANFQTIDMRLDR